MASITPKDDFDAELAAEQFRHAFKGMGTNEDEVIRLLTSHSNAQRQEIAKQFKKIAGTDLSIALKKELKGDFEEICLALMVPRASFDARQLRKAMKGTGTDDSVLVEIMCGRTGEQLEAIKDVYSTEIGRDLEEDLTKETRMQFRRLMVSQCNSHREEGDVDEDNAREDAQTILDAGAEQWGTDEAEIQNILCTRSYAQLNATFLAYKELTGHDIEETIKKETKGHVQKGFLAIVKFAKGPSKFFAEKIHESLKGAGTKDDDLTRLMVSRSETDMKRIAFQFRKMYGVNLTKAIEKDTAKDYRKILLHLAGNEEEEED